MKKYLMMILLILTFLMMPFVHAQELPTSGVSYFLTYPDGREEVTLSYDEATNPSEMLLYEGTTNENGEVILSGWSSEGELRIVQIVPDGYTTNETEMVVNLGTDNSSTFTDYMGLSNPRTGRSILFIVVMASATLFAILLRKNKKLFYVIPITFGLFLAYHVSANENDQDFIIKVKDGVGNQLSNVQVKVYGKPIMVNAAPAIILSANGGHFFDGKEELYVKIPYNGCTIDDVLDYTSPEENDYLDKNIMMAYRNGYYKTDLDFSSHSTLNNGDVIPLIWEQDEEAKVITVHGNGGFFDFYGTKLTELHLYYKGYDGLISVGGAFTKELFSYIGLDDNSTCSHFDESGNSTIDFSEQTEVLENVYACWTKKLDGIYINDNFFNTSPDVCLDNENFEDNGCGSGFTINNHERNQVLHVIDDINGQTGFTMRENISNSFINVPIKSVEIIYHGNKVVYISEDELEYSNLYNITMITNSQKNDLVQEYINMYYDRDNCLVREICEEE